MKDGSKHHVTLTLMDSAWKLFCPARFEGESYLAYRHFKNVPAKPTAGKMVSVYNTKSVVVITRTTPLSMDYNTVKELVTISFYVQRYTVLMILLLIQTCRHLSTNKICKCALNKVYRFY